MGPVFRIVYPDDADVEFARTELQDDVPDHLLHDVLLLHIIPEDYRDHFLDAFFRISCECTEAERLQYLSRVSRLRGSRASSTSQPSMFRTSNASAYSIARSSFASVNNTPATSAPISPIPSTNPPHESYATGLSPHPVSGNSTHTQPHTHTLALSTTAGELVLGTPSGAVNQAADHQPFPRQQSSEQSSSPSKTDRFFDVFRRRKAQKTSKAPKKWKCPVCDDGFTRSDAMETHAVTQCLRPKTFLCHGCSGYYSREAFKKHPQSCSDQGHTEFTLPTRKMYASCLTWRVLSNEANLLADAREFCKSKGPIRPGDQSGRLKAILRSEEIHQEIQRQCIEEFGDPTFWQRLTWNDGVAMRFSSMAEFGLQSVEASSNTDNTLASMQAPGSGLEQYGLGIVNLQEYVTEVITQGRLPSPDTTAPEQGPVNPSGSQTHETQAYDVQSRDAQAYKDAQSRALSHLQTQRRLTGRQPHGQGQPHSSDQQGYNSMFGPSDIRPMSVVMEDAPQSDFDWN